MQQKLRNFYKILFFLYLTILIWILFNRSRYVYGTPYLEQVRRYLNLQPFKTISLYWRLLKDPVRPMLTRLAVYNLLGNLLLFLPMGVMVPTLWEKFRCLPRTLLLVALLVTAAELLQVLILAGSCDIDDLILNLIGAAAGYPCHKILIK